MRVLILDLDTLRPDHLGCYGYHRNTSPNIDAIAAEGVRFNNYFCSDAPCLPSRAALMTGMFGIHSGVINHGGTNADLRLEGPNRNFGSAMRSESLIAQFRKAGYYTASISPFAERHGAFWFYAAFNEMHNTGSGGNESAETISPVALDWIERNAEKDNWLLHVNYWDPHTPYRAPEDFGNPFEDEPMPDWITPEILEKHRNMPGPHCAREVSMYDNTRMKNRPRQLGEIKDMADLKYHFDGYDCGIRYMDEHLGRLFDALKAKGIWDDLAIIITSDHGENQGELGIYAEHATADQITCRIPMIIRWPGGRTGHVAEGFHYNLDLLPTVCEMLDVSTPERADGKSYAATLTDGDDCGNDYLVLSQNCHVCQRSVRFGPWLYMRTWHDGYHLFPQEMLYHIEDDPFEQNDLAETHPEVCNEAARLLQSWHDRMMATQPEGYFDDPMQQVLCEGGPMHAKGRLAGYCEYLEKTGRSWAIEKLREKHPQEFRN